MGMIGASQGPTIDTPRTISLKQFGIVALRCQLSVPRPFPKNRKRSDVGGCLGYTGRDANGGATGSPRPHATQKDSPWIGTKP
jgi:hypothetical protein